MILLKQIPQHAVINNQEKDEPEDPEQHSILSRLHCSRVREGEPCKALRIIIGAVTWPIHLVSAGGKAQVKTLLVEGGTSVMQTNHIKSNESTTLGPQPNLKEFIKTQIVIGLKSSSIFFFQILQILEELSDWRSETLQVGIRLFPYCHWLWFNNLNHPSDVWKYLKKSPYLQEPEQRWTSASCSIHTQTQTHYKRKC